jgi:hypothetical protein
MGIKNSTLTRVKPLFDRIKDDPRKIDVFLSMMSENRSVHMDYSEYKVSYGESEKRLQPPKSLLIWQLENKNRLSIPRNFGVRKTSPSYLKRKKFFEGDPRLLKEARALIEEGSVPAREWYVFEGYTVPDIFIETKRHRIVGEAKRTEIKLTTRTTWLGERDQLVRHIDAVIDSNKEVLSFFLFSKQGFQNAFSQKMNNYSNIEYMKRSLPHRDYDMIKKIAETFIGYSFWEDLGIVFSVEYPDTI